MTSANIWHFQSRPSTVTLLQLTSTIIYSGGYPPPVQTSYMYHPYPCSMIYDTSVQTLRRFGNVRFDGPVSGHFGNYKLQVSQQDCGRSE